MIHFAADFVEQCAQVDDVLDTLSKRSEFVKVKFYKCQAENLPEISLRFKIEAAPTVLYFKMGSVIDRVDGADPAKITAKVKQHSKKEEVSSKPLEERLKNLINKHRIMLFMKGDKETPKCGFSRQMVQILNGTG